MLVVSPLSARGGKSARDGLKRGGEQLLSQPPLSNARVAMQVESLDDGQVIYSRNPDELLNPASNTKLVTAAAGLLRLGPEYRFTTDYLADKPLSRGRIGILYVKGRGDPSVTTERLDGLVSDLWHRGVRSIGDIVLDDSFFDREEFGPGWEQEPSDEAWAAGAGALPLNHNAVAIYIPPADRVGSRALVEVEPEAHDYFVIDNRVTTVRANGRRKLRPRTVSEGERTRIVVEGRIPLHADSMVMSRRVGDPAFYYGQTVRMLLRQRGIRVSGRVKRGAIPQTAVLIQSYDSPELAEIIHDMNKASSNFIAEMVVKTLGAELKGTPGSWPKGLEVAEDLLAELGIPRGTYVLKNGSGLNDTNRFTARQIATLLQAVWKRFPVASEFVSSLGIAARAGSGSAGSGAGGGGSAAGRAASGAEGPHRHLRGIGGGGGQEKPALPPLGAAQRARSSAAHRPRRRRVPQRSGSGRWRAARGDATLFRTVPPAPQRGAGALASSSRGLVPARSRRGRKHRGPGEALRPRSARAGSATR